jgi:two-component system, cell cycle sensor histidine kinase and response regulator CckA
MGGKMGNGRTLAALRENPAAPPNAPNPSVSGTRPATARGRRVLLVEDEDMVRKVLSRMLTGRGLQVFAAASGSEAMALFDAGGQESFDLLVTDLMMPDGGGLSVARALNDKCPGLKVLFVSGYSSAETEGWEPERYRFLTKPFGSSELARVLDELFREEDDDVESAG